MSHFKHSLPYTPKYYSHSVEFRFLKTLDLFPLFPLDLILVNATHNFSTPDFSSQFLHPLEVWKIGITLYNKVHNTLHTHNWTTFLAEWTTNIDYG